MKGLIYLKNAAMSYIVVLFIGALVGQPVLSGVMLTNQTSTGIVNTIIEEENNEEVGDEEASEISIDCQLPNYNYFILGTLKIKTPKIPISKEHSLVLETFIPPPELT